MIHWRALTSTLFVIHIVKGVRERRLQELIAIPNWIVDQLSLLGPEIDRRTKIGAISACDYLQEEFTSSPVKFRGTK